MKNIQDYWEAVIRKQADTIKKYFHSEAKIQWHNTNESFTVEEFIRANCEYPGEWMGKIERMEKVGDLTITVTRVEECRQKSSFHAISFIRWKGDKIISIDEYWGEDGDVPEWRKEKKIGEPIG